MVRSESTPRHWPGSARPPAAAVATGEARDDDVKEGHDTINDGGEDGADAVDDGHQARADGLADGFKLAEVVLVRAWKHVCMKTDAGYDGTHGVVI